MRNRRLPNNLVLEEAEQEAVVAMMVPQPAKLVRPVFYVVELYIITTEFLAPLSKYAVPSAVKLQK